MQKIYIFDNETLKQMQKLQERKLDNEYIVLRVNNGVSDIVQYSKKYDNLHACSVSTEKLDGSKLLK